MKNAVGRPRTVPRRHAEQAKSRTHRRRRALYRLPDGLSCREVRPLAPGRSALEAQVRTADGRDERKPAVTALEPNLDPKQAEPRSLAAARDPALWYRGLSCRHM